MTITLNGTTGITTPGTDSTTLTVNANNISAVNSLGFRNRIINGDMRIDQRNAGASVTPTAGAYTLDRWEAVLTQASKFSVQRNAGSVTPPAGFTNYLGTTSTSAYSVVAGDFFAIRQKIEGFNAADLGWGAAGAQTVTLSFWVRSSLTGTFGGSLYNSDGSRSYPFSYTISAANTWELETITITGDTTGTWGTGNGTGIQVGFSLGSGSTYSGTAGSWSGSFLTSATGAVSVVGTSGATFYITGVQLEAGTVASPFERRDYGRELIMCQRYLPVISASAVDQGVGTGSFYSAATASFVYQFPVAPRVAPTGIIASAPNALKFYSNSANSPSTSITFNTASITAAWLLCGATGTSGAGCAVAANGAMLIQFTGCEL
jgi:hypothetical protein